MGNKVQCAKSVASQGKFPQHTLELNETNFECLMLNNKIIKCLSNPDNKWKRELKDRRPLLATQSQQTINSQKRKQIDQATQSKDQGIRRRRGQPEEDHIQGSHSQAKLSIQKLIDEKIVDEYRAMYVLTDQGKIAQIRQLNSNLHVEFNYEVLQSVNKFIKKIVISMTKER
eukprot:403336684